MTEKEQESLHTMPEIKNAIESKALDIHRQQIYELKGYTIQNEKAINQHADELKKLEAINETLETQVLQLSEAVQLIIEHLEESKNQTGELANSKDFLVNQIKDMENVLEKQEKINKSQGKKNKILFTITIILFCITVLTILSNSNIYNFIKKFLGV